MYVCMYVCMTRVVSISDEAYNELKKLKNGMSFSEIIIELSTARKKGNIAKYAGVLSKDEADKILKEIMEERKRISRRML